MSKMNSSKRGKRGGNRRNKQRGLVIPHPPPIRGLEIAYAPTLRFRATAAAVQTSITFQNLLDTLLVASTATAGFDLFQAVRIRSVKIWGIAAVGTPTSVALEFDSLVAGLTGDHQIHTDTSMGIEPAFVEGRPSTRTLAGMWQVSSGAQAFLLSCPAGAVIDVLLSLRGPTFAQAPVAAQFALVGATAGEQYVRGLDGIATAGTNFVPEFTPGQI